MTRELKNFFGTLGQRAISNEKDFFLYRKLGIKMNTWPKTCTSGALSVFLENLDTQQGSYWKARQTALYAFAENDFDLVLLPENELELLNLYHKNLRAAQSIELATEISKNPELADTLIDSFRRQFVSSTKPVSKQELGLIYMSEWQDPKNNHLIEIKGFEKLSSLIGGFNGGRVTIISAHTGFGKSNLVLNLAEKAIQSNIVTAICNMEMMTKDIMDRFTAINTRATHEEIRLGKIDWSKLIEYYSNDFTKNLFITDGKNLSVSDIYSYCYQLKNEKDLKLVFIDYDQKIDILTDARTPEWKALQLATHAIEAIAKELNIHIVLLAQANDEGTPSGSKRSMYPSSVVLWFTKLDDNYILKPIKNRFGPTNKSIIVDYQPEKSLITEKGIYEHKPQDRNGSFESFRNSNGSTRYPFNNS